MKTDIYDVLDDASEAFANAVEALGNIRFKADYARFIASARMKSM